MTASPRRRRRTTIVGLVTSLALCAAAAVLVVVGALTLSNSQEGEAVGVDERPVSVLPATPNSLLAVVDGDELASVVIATLLPEGVGGSLVVVPPNADATASYGSERQPLNALFDADDIEGFATSVEQMLSIAIERQSVVDVDDLESLVGVEADIEGDVEADADAWPDFWADVAETAPIADAITAPVDSAGVPVAPADTTELVARLLAGEVQSRPLAVREPTAAQNPTDADVVVVDRRDAILVFAQVSPALVSTPNTGLTVRIVAPFTEEQIEASDGRYDSTSELVIDVIGEMLFFQANVVSVDTQTADGGAGEMTVIEVSDERFVEDLEAIAPIVFGDSDVRLASSLIEGIDVVVVLGTDYIATKVSRAAEPDEPTDISVPPDDTVTTDE